jgi:hypothetical protein
MSHEGMILYFIVQWAMDVVFQAAGCFCLLIAITSHLDTQAIFTSVASFHGFLGRSLQRVASRLFPEHTTVIGQYYFRFERNNAMNAMEAIDGEPCICIE